MLQYYLKNKLTGITTESINTNNLRDALIYFTEKHSDKDNGKWSLIRNCGSGLHTNQGTFEAFI